MITSYRSGIRIHLRHLLAQSGQGSVYFTDTPGILAKIYNADDEPERLEKMKVMIALPPDDPAWESIRHLSIAWPRDLLVENGRCIGILMPRVLDAQDLTHVYNPVLRARFAPRFNWYYLHCAAYNYVSAMEAIHARGYVVGDIKPQNILVNPRALISIIDTDSFQVSDPQNGRIFRCPVGSEGFSAPEVLKRLSGGKFAEIDRGPEQDRFGMAVIIYLLLFGRHPFSEGRWLGAGDAPGPDERVLKGLWIHGNKPELGIDPGSIPLTVVHPETAACFRRCFNEGYENPSRRPDATEWKLALKAAIAELERCDAEHNHYYYSSNSHGCFWCARSAKVGVDIFSSEPRTKHVHAIPLPAMPAKPLRINRVAIRKAPLSRSVHINFSPNIIPGIVGVLFVLLFLHTAFDTKPGAVPSGESRVPRIVDGTLDIAKITVNASDLGTIQQVAHGDYVVETIEPVVKDDQRLIAYPKKYDTGKCTYVCSRHIVFEKDLGPMTPILIQTKSKIEPDKTWSVVASSNNLLQSEIEQNRQRLGRAVPRSGYEIKSLLTLRDGMHIRSIMYPKIYGDPFRLTYLCDCENVYQRDLGSDTVERIEYLGNIDPKVDWTEIKQ